MMKKIRDYHTDQYIYMKTYTYIKKEEDESLNYIKNYKDITQNDFEKYAKSNSSKNSTKVNYFNESLWILLQI